MLSWLENEILGMPRIDYQVLYGILLVGFALLLYYAFVAFRRYRIMNGTATSRIRSAAQGHVELKGLAEFMQNGVIQSPFSGSRCVWYHCTIDKRTRTGKRTTWANISDECSGQLFRLVDDTGDCIIDPDHAHVIPETDLTWYGDHTESRSQVPAKKRLVSFNPGKYRFRERLIRPATPIYAMGWFKTIYSNVSDELIAEQTADLVKQWKLQPHRYLSEFDTDQNGKIQQREWKAIRAEARKQILARNSRQQQEYHVISRPNDKRHPYILSAVDEDVVVSRKRLKAYASLALAFLIFGTLVTLFSIRAPIPI